MGDEERYGQLTWLAKDPAHRTIMALIHEAHTALGYAHGYTYAVTGVELMAIMLTADTCADLLWYLKFAQSAHEDYTRRGWEQFPGPAMRLARLADLRGHIQAQYDQQRALAAGKPSHADDGPVAP